MKKFLIITPIVLVILCGFGIVIAALSGAGSTDTTISDGSDGGTTSTIGQPARDGKFEFTVLSVKTGVSSVGGEWGQEAQGQFVLVKLRVSNIGDEPQYLFSDNQYAYDSKGSKFASDGAAAVYANKNADIWISEINPGNSVTGTIVFDVPNKTKLTKLELHDSAFSGGVTVNL